MAPNIQPSTSKKKYAKLPSPQQEIQGQHFFYEEKCFLMHHANYCTDFEVLREIFNMQFDTDRSLDSIESILTKCEDEEFFQLTEAAERYKKWYTEHPMRPVVPIILLGSSAMRTELRAYLAYRHYHGMGLDELNKNFNLAFPTETRDARQIATQLNLFKNNNQLLNSLTGFSVRYQWHPQHKPTAKAPNPATKKPSATSKAAKKAKKRQSKQTAKAAQTGLINQRTESEEDSQVAQKELVVKYTDTFGHIIAGPLTPLIFPAAATATPLAATFPGPRPGHAAGRARSASPVRDSTRGKGELRRGRRGSM